MEVYIEAIYLINWFIVLLSLQMMNLLLNVKESIKKTIKHTFYLSTMIIGLYVDIDLFVVILWLFLFIYLYQRQFFLFYPVFLLIYGSITRFISSFHETTFLFHGILILPNQYLSIFLIIELIVIGILETIYVIYCRRKIQLGEYLLDVVLYLNHQKIKCKGFLDTGNEVYYQGYPLLLLNKELIQEYQIIDSIAVDNIKNVVLDVIKIDQLEINHQYLKDVYVGLIDSIKYDCLLNKQLMGGIL